MGNQICVGKSANQQPFTLSQLQIAQSVSKSDCQDLHKRLIANRVQINSLPHINPHVEERIKKLSKNHRIDSKIWKIKSINLIYINVDPKQQNELPKGCVQLYKLKENGDFQGYFEGQLDENFQPQLSSSIFVFSNAGYFIGTGKKQGIYNNEVTNLKYEGEWEHQNPHGKGIQKNNKGVYEGNFNLGEKQGQGIFTWTDGSLYEGTFVKGLFHGKGVLKDSSKNYTYQGEFKFGQKEGKGIQKSGDQVYTGQFYKGRRCGQGVLTINCIEKGITKTYNGYFNKGLPNGKGAYKIQNQCTIEGIWQQGRLISIQ